MKKKSNTKLRGKKKTSRGRGPTPDRLSSKKRSAKKAPSKKSPVRVRVKKEEEVAEGPSTPARTETILKAFNEVWQSLFSSPVHLDSALSKLPARTKTTLAQILPQILLRPASQAEALGIGISAGEPWSLNLKQLANWRPPALITERLYQMMTHRGLSTDPMLEDFPESMIAEWESTWGKDTLYELVDTLGREAPLSLRASRRVGAGPLLDGLKKETRLPVKAELSQLSPMGVRLSGYAPVLNTEWYKRGSFEIQDEGSQLMALFALWPERYGAILKERPGKVGSLEFPAPPPPKETPVWTMVDACAGAGGKSLALGDLVKGKGRIIAYDTSEKKLQALRRRATHAGLNNIQAVPLKEGAEIEVVGQFKETADLVLVDAPCSGWGVLRRNPDIKWRQESEILKRMPEIQYRLLSLYSQLVKPGGRLVFGVCTFRKEETRDVVDRFLKAHPQFEGREGGYLGPGPCDGFYMHAFVKSNS